MHDPAERREGFGDDVTPLREDGKAVTASGNDMVEVNGSSIKVTKFAPAQNTTRQ